VRWATTSGPSGADPHAYDNASTNAVLPQVFDYLLDRDLQQRPEPSLAVSWKPLDPLTWEFKLREGVRFHDGSPFTAEDVVFSLKRAQSEGSAQQAHLGNIAKLEATGPYTVRITTVRPSLFFWADVYNTEMLSKAWAERHGAELPIRPGDASAYAQTHANGTGPFRLESIEPERRAVLVRNPDWWGKERWPHNIDRVEQIAVASPEQGAELVLKGEADLLTSPPLDQITRLQETPGLVVKKAGSPAVLYLAFDQGSPELRSSDIKGKNPFKDRRVREAVYRAIDPERIVNALHGLGVPAGALLVTRGVNGWSEELD
jgi:peptide/nickel transport system substrate-binding protein